MPEDDRSISLEELEELSYYDFMGCMDVPFFNIGGVGSIDRLAELCEITESSKVLVVGCGTGSIDNVREGEKVFQELTELPFTLNSPPEWRQAFENAAFVDIIIEEYPDLRRQGNSLKMVKEFEGLGRLVRTLVEMLLPAARSSEPGLDSGRSARGSGYYYGAKWQANISVIS